ncbi:hypothetical protein ISF_01442 [Cordyceps fumosorosea ARSEF 2679]|uniref:Uncharacterized protein n=1 Tax=Cordyceps fumosorosea (strain ARSEF 2679) TaxID=1081104 RepID=A0A162MXV7_CORFA|nr:hypothetical protein ISF_01442 [Cordyceps fumosorosea ARSEF 2679]OAA72369.1 hypothetical protein ISF_01442 [Cordyceps fumosorosea ARSEF 2679]
MARPRASNGLLRNRIRRQPSLTPPSTSPTSETPPGTGSGSVPKIRLESLMEEEEKALFPGTVGVGPSSNNARVAAEVRTP